MFEQPGRLFCDIIFSFNFRFLSAFIAWLTKRERLTSDCSFRNWRQRGTSWHKIRTNYVPMHCREMVSHVG